MVPSDLLAAVILRLILGRVAKLGKDMAALVVLLKSRRIRFAGLAQVKSRCNQGSGSAK